MLAGAVQSAPAFACGGRFTLAGASAIDRSTGLEWARCSLGFVWTDGACAGEATPLDFAAAQEAAARAGGGWRLPQAEELLKLADRTCGRPALDREAFPDVSINPTGEGTLYWSATPAGILEMIGTVDFEDGSYDIHSRGLAYHVRLVRAARTPSEVSP